MAPDGDFIEVAHRKIPLDPPAPLTQAGAPPQPVLLSLCVALSTTCIVSGTLRRGAGPLGRGVAVMSQVAPELYRAARGGEAAERLEGEAAVATAALFFAARTGDISRVAYLLETSSEAEADAFDAWQSTPLFYAALCGHEEVCRLLLAAGAKCDRLTYDGERCLYAALNDRVRRVLLDSGFSYAAARSHDAYLEQLENMYDDTLAQAAWRDAAFIVGTGADAVRLEAHRGVVAARCPHLAQRFSARGTELRLPGAKFPAAALSSVLRWCYTGRLAVAAEDAKATARLLAALKLRPLADALRREAASAPKRQQQLALEPPRADAKAEMQQALSALADACSDADADAAGLGPEAVELLRGGAVRLRVDGELFFAHAGFLCPRSGFFAAMLDARWRGASASDEAALLDVSAMAFRAALRWAYTDIVDAATPLPQLLELLAAADQMLLEPLKQRAALLLVPHVKPDSCVPLLRVAEAAAVPRLSAAAAATVAEGLEELADDAELAAAVADSAASIRSRQATDSIPVLDEIAFHVRRLHGGDDEDWDDDTPLAWDAPGLMPEERAAAVAAARHGAAAVRLRKMAVVRQLAAAVQGWEVRAVRTHT